PPRSNKVTPSSSSSLRMATDNVGWLTKQASAARPKCLSRATATMYFNSVNVMTDSVYAFRLCLQIVFAPAPPAPQLRSNDIRSNRQQLRRQPMRLFGNFNILIQVRKTQQRQAGLPHAQELSRPPQLKIPARDFKPVIGLIHGFQAQLGHLGQGPLIQQNT